MTKSDVVDFLTDIADTHTAFTQLNQDVQSHVLNRLKEILLEHNEVRPLPPLKAALALTELRNIIAGMIGRSVTFFQKNIRYSTLLKPFLDDLKQIFDDSGTLEISTVRTLKSLYERHFSIIKMFSLKVKRSLMEELCEVEKVPCAVFVEQLTIVKNKYQELYNSYEQNTGDLSFHDELIALMRVSLHFYIQLYAPELKEPTGPVHIIHCYESTGLPRAAEFLGGYDSDNSLDLNISFEHTSHGLGSGVYGVLNMDAAMVDEQCARKSCYQIVEIINPLRLSARDITIGDANNSCTIAEADYWTEVSKRLQAIAQQAKTLQFFQKATQKIDRIDALTQVLKHPDNNLNSMAKMLANFDALKNIAVAEMEKYLLTSLQEFLKDARPSPDPEKDDLAQEVQTAAHKMVAMPINYLLQKLNFNGVVGGVNDCFGKGLVLTDEGALTQLNWIKIPVKMTRRPSLEKLQQASPMRTSTPHPLDNIINTPIPSGASSRQSPPSKKRPAC